MLFLNLRSVFFITAAAGTAVRAIGLNVNDTTSIKNAAGDIAYDMMIYWSGNQTNPSSSFGLYNGPYYFWEAGGMWGAMIDYWHLTGDTSYLDVMVEAVYAQASPTMDFKMPALAAQLGNDDQVFWGLSAMSAVEYQLPQPRFSNTSTASNVWLELAENVVNDLQRQWAPDDTCKGGLRWQFNPANNGYFYKSSIANGGFFQLAARLARYTGNTTYVDWASTTWDWMVATNLIDSSFNVYDGTDVKINCTAVDHNVWSYNAGIFLYGSAVLANVSGNDHDRSTWTTRTQGLLDATSARFFSPYPNATNVAFEFMCEEVNLCNADEISFKAYLARWMTTTAKMLPAMRDQIMNLVVPSAKAAAASCSGQGKNSCGIKWYTGGWDGTNGVGQQMAALEIVLGLLVDKAGGPTTG